MGNRSKGESDIRGKKDNNRQDGSKSKSLNNRKWRVWKKGIQ